MCVRNYGANVSYILGTNLLFTRSNLWITLSTLGSNGVEQDSERGCVTVMEEMCGDVSKEECGFVDEKICDAIPEEICDDDVPYNQSGNQTK